MDDGRWYDERWDCVGIYSKMSCHPEDRDLHKPDYEIVPGHRELCVAGLV